MIPKSNARKCYLNDSAAFFDFAGIGPGFTPGESYFGSAYLIGVVAGTVLWMTAIHKLSGSRGHFV